MKSLKNGVHNLSDNKIYRECYHGIASIANGGPHIRINVKNIAKKCQQTFNFNSIVNQTI